MSIDSAGKVNAIGAGWQMVQRVSGQDGGALGLPAHFVLALIDVPAAHGGEQFAVTLVLEDAHGGPVEAVNPLTGERRPLRVQQLAAPAAPPGSNLAGGRLPRRVTNLLGLQAGVPVEHGQLYRWILEIDGHRSEQWQAEFYVLPEQTPPVFG